MIWTPPSGISLLRFRAREKLVVLPDGRRAKVTVDDSGTVQHTETDEQLDATVRPNVTVYRNRKG